MVFRLKVASVVVVSVLALVGITAVALAKDSTRFDASLSGYEELLTLSTRGNGTFEASLNKDGSMLHYTLSYEGPFDGNATGTAASVTQAHIHFGARCVQRRCLRVPVLESRERAGRYTSVSDDLGLRER